MRIKRKTTGLAPGAATNVLPARWTPLRPHPEQARYIQSRARFNVNSSGRRSGKTELAKRKIVWRALNAHRRDLPGLYIPHQTSSFFIAAPTFHQVRRIYWEDIKSMIPTWAFYGAPNATTLTIRLVNGAMIQMLGMDEPARIEGSPWDGGVLDEYGNMKPVVWPQHIRPALSDRRGWCDFIGVPEGRNHYYDLWKSAKATEAEAAAAGKPSQWATFHWNSEDILDPEEIEAAKKDLDEATYLQEYCGSFVNFSGRAYYSFDENIHCAPLSYNPKAPLIICFDFNVDPGVAAICQEQRLPNGLEGTGVIGEIYIPRNSNTLLVLNKIVNDWHKHEGFFVLYGDSTGGSRGSAKVQGSDWILILQRMRQEFGGDRVMLRVPSFNPRERDRVNAVNSRLKSMTGEVRMMVDPHKAPNVVKDFEGVTVLEGGCGEIDKRADARLTHISDAIGYYIVHEFPIKRRYGPSGQKYWK